MEFLWSLVESKGTAKVFPPDFPLVICQALALRLAKPGMSWVDAMRSVYILAAAGVEVIAIAHLMNLCQERLLTITGGMPEAILAIEVGACQCAIFHTILNLQFPKLASTVPTLTTPLNTKPLYPLVFLPLYVKSHQEEQRTISPLDKTIVQLHLVSLWDI